MDEPLAIGIDVGATYSKMGLVNFNGALLDHRVFPSDLQGSDPSRFIAAVESVTAGWTASFPVRGIGVSLCSILNEQRTGVLLSVNAPALAGLDFPAILSQRFGLPVRVGNDVAAFALAEARFGAGVGVRRLLVLALGTGLAIAVVIDGRLLETWGGIPGDAGRIVLDPASELRCKAGVRGSAEALLGVANIERLACAAYQRGEMTAREVIEAAGRGESPAVEVMAQIGAHTGHLLALLSPVFFPQRILITGGTAEAGEPLFSAARRRYIALVGGYMDTLSQLEAGQSRSIEIRKAALGPEAAVLGAALPFLFPEG